MEQGGTEWDDWDTDGEWDDPVEQWHWIFFDILYTVFVCIVYAAFLPLTNTWIPFVVGTNIVTMVARSAVAAVGATAFIYYQMYRLRLFTGEPMQAVALQTAIAAGIVFSKVAWWCYWAYMAKNTSRTSQT